MWPVRAALSGRGLGKTRSRPFYRSSSNCRSKDWSDVLIRPYPIMAMLVPLSFSVRGADRKKPRNPNRLRGIDFGTDLGGSERLARAIARHSQPPGGSVS